MNRSIASPFLVNSSSRRGFSLIEVVLAIGIFLVTVLALVGLLGPTLQSVDEVEKSDEVASIVNTVNAFLQSSPDIGNAGATPAVSKFDAIYNAVYDSAAADGHATIFVFRSFVSDTDNNIKIEIGFHGDETLPNADAKLQAVDFANVAGPIYRVVLTASSVIPDTLRTGRNGDNIYVLSQNLAGYLEGYLAMEVRIFVLAQDIANARSNGGTMPAESNLTELKNIEPIFTYNTAVVR